MLSDFQVIAAAALHMISCVQGVSSTLPDGGQLTRSFKLKCATAGDLGAL